MATLQTIILILTPLIFINLAANTYASTISILKTSPETVTLTYGSNLILNVTVENVTDLCAWQIKLFFDPKFIICQTVSVPQDNILGNNTTGLSKEINNTEGYIKAFNGLWELEGVNGSGVLCQITFQTASLGITGLYFENVMNFSGTYLADSENNLIEFQSEGSVIEILTTDFQEYSFDIDVNGTPATIKILTNSTINNFTYTHQAQIIEFDTNQTQGTQGLHSIMIPKIAMEAPIVTLVNGVSVPYHLFIDSVNTYLNFNCSLNTHVKILSTILGDLTGDRQVLIDDIVIVAKAYGSYEGSSRWDPRADMDDNKIVDIYDLSVVARRFGSVWS